MKFTGVEIWNFMGFRHAKYELNDKGLVSIEGVNDDDSSADSNGSGKSALVDALFWCLEGETARGSSADGIINWHVNKDCRVKVDIEEIPGEGYVVERWRKMKGKHKASACSLVTYGGSGPVDLTKGTDKLTQVEIDRALGCSKDVFTAAIYAGQEKLPNLPGMTDTELKTLIEAASGVDTLSTAYRIARDRLIAIERDQDRWRLDHVRAERDVNDTTTRLADLKISREGFEGKRRDELKVLGDDVRNHVANARVYQGKVADVKVVPIENAIADLDVKVGAVSLEQAEERRLSIVYSDAAGKHTSLQAVYDRAVKDARAQKVKIDELTARVGTPCEECGKPYEVHDLGSASAIAHGKLAELVARATELREDVALREKTALEAHQKLAEYRASRTDVSATVAERTRLQELLRARERASDALASETAAAQRCKAQFDALKLTVNPLIEIVERGEIDLADSLKTHRTSEELGVDIEKRIMVAKDVVKVFGPAGVRAHILDNVTPYLNDRTADCLSTLSDGMINAVWSTLSLNAKGELTERFAINVTMDGKGSFNDLSGGQKRKVRLACALALQDLVASRASKPIDLWIGDEIDDALDDAGLERLMTVLEAKARERGTVLVISHNSLNDWIRDSVTVTMKGGESKLSGVLVPV